MTTTTFGIFSDEGDCIMLPKTNQVFIQSSFNPGNAFPKITMTCFALRINARCSV